MGKWLFFVFQPGQQKVVASLKGMLYFLTVKKAKLLPKKYSPYAVFTRVQWYCILKYKLKKSKTKKSIYFSIFLPLSPFVSDRRASFFRLPLLLQALGLH